MSVNVARIALALVAAASAGGFAATVLQRMNNQFSRWEFKRDELDGWGSSSADASGVELHAWGGSLRGEVVSRRPFLDSPLLNVPATDRTTLVVSMRYNGPSAQSGGLLVRLTPTGAAAPPAVYATGSPVWPSDSQALKSLEQDPSDSSTDTGPSSRAVSLSDGSRAWLVRFPIVGDGRQRSYTVPLAPDPERDHWQVSHNATDRVGGVSFRDGTIPSHDGLPRGLGGAVTQVRLWPAMHPDPANASSAIGSAAPGHSFEITSIRLMEAPSILRVRGCVRVQPEAEALDPRVAAYAMWGYGAVDASDAEAAQRTALGMMPPTRGVDRFTSYRQGPGTLAAARAHIPSLMQSVQAPPAAVTAAMLEQVPVLSAAYDLHLRRNATPPPALPPANTLFVRAAGTSAEQHFRTAHNATHLRGLGSDRAFDPLNGSTIESSLPASMAAWAAAVGQFGPWDGGALALAALTAARRGEHAVEAARQTLPSGAELDAAVALLAPGYYAPPAPFQGAPASWSDSVRAVSSRPFTATYGCQRAGGDRIRIEGLYLGSGDSVRVAVGGRPCTDAIHLVDQEVIECTSPPGEGEQAWVTVSDSRTPELTDSRPFFSYAEGQTPPVAYVRNVGALHADMAVNPHSLFDALATTGYMVQARAALTAPEILLMYGTLNSTELPLPPRPPPLRVNRDGQAEFATLSAEPEDLDYLRVEGDGERDLDSLQHPYSPYQGPVDPESAAGDPDGIDHSGGGRFNALVASPGYQNSRSRGGWGPWVTVAVASNVSVIAVAGLRAGHWHQLRVAAMIEDTVSAGASRQWQLTDYNGQRARMGQSVRGPWGPPSRIFRTLEYDIDFEYFSANSTLAHGPTDRDQGWGSMPFEGGAWAVPDAGVGHAFAPADGVFARQERSGAVASSGSSGRRPIAGQAAILGSSPSQTLAEAEAQLGYARSGGRVPSVGPLGNTRGEGQFGLLLVGSAHIAGCNGSHACCDGYAVGGVDVDGDGVADDTTAYVPSHWQLSDSEEHPFAFYDDRSGAISALAFARSMEEYLLNVSTPLLLPEAVEAVVNASTIRTVAPGASATVVAEAVSQSDGAAMRLVDVIVAALEEEDASWAGPLGSRPYTVSSAFAHVAAGAAEAALGGEYDAGEAGLAHLDEAGNRAARRAVIEQLLFDAARRQFFREQHGLTSKRDAAARALLASNGTSRGVNGSVPQWTSCKLACAAPARLRAGAKNGLDVRGSGSAASWAPALDATLSGDAKGAQLPVGLVAAPLSRNGTNAAMQGSTGAQQLGRGDLGSLSTYVGSTGRDIVVDGGELEGGEGSGARARASNTTDPAAFDAIARRSDAATPRYPGHLWVGPPVMLSRPPLGACGPALRITGSHPRQTGAAWYARPQQVREGFEASFHFRISSPSVHCGRMDDAYTRCRSRGGDGFAFVLQTQSPTAMGRGGSGLGYSGLPGSIAVEFDTHYSDALADPWENHVSVHVSPSTRGRVNSHHVSSLGHGFDGVPDLTDSVHRARIVYEPAMDERDVGQDAFVGDAAATAEMLVSRHAGGIALQRDEDIRGQSLLGRGLGSLSVFMDGAAKPSLVVPIDLEAVLATDNGRAWVGFTAATGPDVWQVHDILEWRLTQLRRPLMAIKTPRLSPDGI